MTKRLIEIIKGNTEWIWKEYRMDMEGIQNGYRIDTKWIQNGWK